MELIVCIHNYDNSVACNLSKENCNAMIFSINSGPTAKRIISLKKLLVSDLICSTILTKSISVIFFAEKL